MKNTPSHIASEWRKIDFRLLLLKLMHEVNPVDIVDAVEDIQSFAYDSSQYRKGFVYLVEFNQFTSEIMEDLQLSPEGEKIFQEFLDDMRHNLELSIRYESVNNMTTCVLQQYKQRFIAWLQKIRYYHKK